MENHRGEWGVRRIMRPAEQRARQRHAGRRGGAPATYAEAATLLAPAINLIPLVEW